MVRRDALRSIDPEQHPDFDLMRDRFERRLAEPKRLAEVSTLIGVTAVGLAIIGIFGLTACLVSQRRHEIGVRLAIGADTRDVVRLMIRDSLRPLIVGMTFGLIPAFSIATLVRAQLYGVSPADPFALAAVFTLLIGSACLAAWWPARRAAHIDPTEALRD
jgi:ABC-type antimicrobial peptide transport system permease subunit